MARRGRRHLVYLDYLDRIDRDLSSCSRADSNVGAVVGETHVLHERPERWSRAWRRSQRTKGIFESFRPGDNIPPVRTDRADDFRLREKRKRFRACRFRFAITKRVASAGNSRASIEKIRHRSIPFDLIPLARVLLALGNGSRSTSHGIGSFYAALSPARRGAGRSAVIGGDCVGIAEVSLMSMTRIVVGGCCLSRTGGVPIVCRIYSAWLAFGN